MQQRYNYAFFDEASKREIRRALVKGVSIPGYQVPFASREMPIGRGWGTGGLQITLAIIGPDDTLKVIDQGSDDSVRPPRSASTPKPTTPARGWNCSTRSCASMPPPPAPTILCRCSAAT